MNTTLNPFSFGRGNPAHSVRFALTLALALAGSGTARAAFNSSGFDTFTGTSVDTATWLETNPDFITQNNAVFIATAAHAGYPTQLTTSTVQLGVGSSARIQVTVTDHSPLSNYSQLVYLGLTTADSPRGNILFDSYSVSSQLSFNPTSPGFSASYSYGTGGNGTGRTFTTYLNTPYFLQLDRLSDTSVNYSVLNSAGALIYQNLRSLPSYTDPLYIAFGTDSVDATFDNLRITGNIVPEPSVVALLALAGSVALMRRKQG